jgi:hypothetical protein
MILTSRRRRPVATAAVSALVALTVLTGCAQEEPTNDEVSSSAPTVEDALTTTAEPTGTADDSASTSSAPDDEAVTSAAPDDAASTSEREPTGVAAADDSFKIEIPGRWEDAIDLVEDETILVAVKDTERIDDFYTNVVVTQEDSVPNLSEAVQDTAKELAGKDGEYELLDPVDVDGDRAPGYTLVREVQGTTVHQTQRWVSHDGTLYVVTFSAVDSQVEDAAPALEDILSSWSWQD